MTDAGAGAGRFATWWHEPVEELGFAHAYDMKLLHQERSPYQNIEVFEHAAFGRILVLDGLVQASEADEFIYHEMAVHVPLLGRRRAGAGVLIVGGGDGGILREVLRHDFVERVVMVEIDRTVIEVANAYLGINGDYGDPRVELICEDAAAVLRRFADAGRTFEVVILDITDPVGPSQSLFTDRFLTDLAACLAEDGVCVDSDSIFVARDGVRVLQEACGGSAAGLLETMRTRRFLPRIEGYRSIVPLYPGAEFGFFLYSKDGYSYAEPRLEFTGRHYNPALHRAAFALPTWWREQLGF